MYKCLSVRILVMFLFILFMVSACSHHDTSIESEKSKKQVKVEVAKPQLNEYTEPFTISGSIKAHQKSVLSSKIVGHILNIAVDEGSIVKAGQILVKVDDSKTKLEVANAKAEEFKLKATQEALLAEYDELKNRIQMLFHDQERYLSEAELAQANFDRYKKLLEKDIATQAEYDDAKTVLDKANATVAKSQAEYNMLMAKKAQLDAKSKQLAAQIDQNQVQIANSMVDDAYTQIVTPLNGIVVKKLADVGDIVNVGQPILEVENPEALYLEVNVEESQALIFIQGAKIEVYIDAYNKSIAAQVREVVPASDPESHTMKVKIDLPPHELLHSGLYARVVVPMSGKNYFIPRTAVLTKGQVKGVFVVDKNNVARFRIIKIGQEIQGFIEITSGLNEDDKVIISNLNEVTDGTKVDVLGE
ncbi:MAG: efflux RND transporter periplasmic adaptor subunit [Vampirovibrionia bacterium]